MASDDNQHPYSPENESGFTLRRGGEVESPETRDPPVPRCPVCGNEAHRVETRWGFRDSCCGLHSWHGKPLVSQRVHDARTLCHEVVDALWKGDDSAPRKLVYKYLSHLTGIPPERMHMSTLDDLDELRSVYRIAVDSTPDEIIEWGKE